MDKLVKAAKENVTEEKEPSPVKGMFWGAAAQKQLDPAYPTPFLLGKEPYAPPRPDRSHANDYLNELVVKSSVDEAAKKEATKVERVKPDFHFGANVTDAEGTDGADNLMAVMRTIMEVVRKKLEANDGLPNESTSLFSAPNDKDIEGPYYTEAVKKEDFGYFVDEVERSERNQSSDKRLAIGWLKKAHYDVKDHEDYCFDRNYVSWKEQKKRKNPNKSAGVGSELEGKPKVGLSMHSHIGWKDPLWGPTRSIGPKVDESGNEVAEQRNFEKALKKKSMWVSLQAASMEKSRKRFEHLLHLLEEQQRKEIDRTRQLVEVSLAGRRKKHEVVARVARERAEAADWIMRILNGYNFLSGLELAGYLTSTLKMMSAQGMTNDEDEAELTAAGIYGGAKKKGAAPKKTMSDYEFMTMMRSRSSTSNKRKEAEKAKTKARAKAVKVQNEGKQRATTVAKVSTKPHQNKKPIPAQHALSAVKHTDYEQRRRRKAGIGDKHTGHHSLLNSHAATEIMWKLDERDRRDVEKSGKYKKKDGGRMGGKDLFMQLTALPKDQSRTYCFPLSQQMDTFINTGEKNPSSMPPKLPEAPPASAANTPRDGSTNSLDMNSIFRHIPGQYTNGEAYRFEQY
jgi:hypothetical protein